MELLLNENVRLNTTSAPRLFVLCHFAVSKIILGEIHAVNKNAQFSSKDAIFFKTDFHEFQQHPRSNTESIYKSSSGTVTIKIAYMWMDLRPNVHNQIGMVSEWCECIQVAEVDS